MTETLLAFRLASWARKDLQLRVGIARAGNSSGRILVHAHGSLVRGMISSLVVVLCMGPVALIAGSALAEESGEDLATMRSAESSKIRSRSYGH